jgi:oxepin-CoA hydrolase/3-oxo-5,6-dehydrosuberyl-CoA semialdehyde dehydrogenase
MAITRLDSYLCGRWQTGNGKTTALYNPATEEQVAEASTEGLDFKAAVKFARETGGPALRSLSFAQRAEVLKKLAKVLSDAREELITLGIVNAGNTRSDAKFDIDGGAGTIMFYAGLGEKLGDSKVIADGEGVQLGRSARLFGQHVLVPRSGVAVHINAFNFPAWGMAEKLGQAFLAGMPVITKPATATALMAHRIMKLWVDSGALPEGSLQFVCGSTGDLLAQLSGQDVLAFTGSGHTAETLKKGENFIRDNVHVNVEADSLNSAVLGPDVQTGAETLNLFVQDVVKEMTQKTGQKCTAIRRIYVPEDKLAEVRDVLVERLSDVKVGDPSNDKVTMGPVATAAQLRDVKAGIEKLAAGAELACGGSKAVEPLGGAAGKGFFVAPTLIVRKSPAENDLCNQLEVFGPVATLMPYKDATTLVKLVAAGGGGLVSSVYSDDRQFVQEMVMGLGPFHGRLTLGSEKVAGQSVPPGTVLPQLLHGGPGRAGGGEELGGLRGMSLYMQRVALQGDRAVIEKLAPQKTAAPQS